MYAKEYSNLPAHPCAFWIAVDAKSLHVDNGDWSDYANAQADLSLRLAHTSESTFSQVAAQMMTNLGKGPLCHIIGDWIHTVDFLSPSASEIALAICVQVFQALAICVWIFQAAASVSFWQMSGLCFVFVSVHWTHYGILEHLIPLKPVLDGEVGRAYMLPFNLNCCHMKSLNITVTEVFVPLCIL